MDRKAFCHIIDHTLLKPEATREQIEKLCIEARENEFATVAIEPVYIPFAASLLQGSKTGITSAIAYPHGSWSIKAKCHEIGLCLKAGASDCDYVLDLGALKEGNWDQIRKEARECRKATGSAILKIILEVSLLTDEEVRIASLISAEEGADFVKTATGYLASPTIEQVAIMTEAVAGTKTSVKAAGGFSSMKRVQQALDLGVKRIGTSSAFKLLEELQS
jgi:deoxyribose-phosphate aldolase